MIQENSRTRAHIDWFLIILVYGLSIFGIVAVSVATFSTTSEVDVPFWNHVVESSYAIRQSLFVFIISPIVLVLLMNAPYVWLNRYAPLLYYLSVFLLTVVWVFNRAEGVKAWLDVLWGFTIQPSEFAKLSMILILARVLSTKDIPMSNLPDTIRVFAILGLPAFVIIASGEMGSLIVIGVIAAMMMLFSGAPWQVLVGLAAAAVIGAAAIFGFLMATGSDSYRLIRILAFLNPEQYSASGAYQQTQSKIAIGSGGLNGIGTFVPGAMSQLNYVPADWTDFIFATIGEAWGFRGCMLLIFAYLVLILYMMYLAYNTRDKFGQLIIIGVTGMMLFHVVENIGMAIGILPITGIPLPFISYGGSNMVTCMGGIALVLNVTKNRSLTAQISTPQRQAIIQQLTRA
ncbi:MAG: rod shape-determining protein RodA [Clostridia bacterium]|nr:rod shape-determining protein RodA [Clostridia bacterium]